MIQRNFRSIGLRVIAIAFAFGTVITVPAMSRSAQDRRLTVHVQEVFSAKASLLPFKGLKTAAPIAEVTDIKNGEAATLAIPAVYLPGEFVLRIDYRAKEADAPYPAERIIYVNEQDVDLTVSPPFINNDEKTKFKAGEEENTVYSAFMKANSVKRLPVDLLRQFLLSYDRPRADFYARGVNEFEQRRLEYNAWLSEQATIHKKLFISHLFGFQHIPAVAWGGDEKERQARLTTNYFDGIDFNDSLIVRTREMSQFMDAYMGLYGVQAATVEMRDSLFTQAGSVACEKASKGDPQVYGWMVDYFYAGYETYGIKNGMAMLQKHINNTNCLTAKKRQIAERLEGTARLVPGALSPDFVMIDDRGKNFKFHEWMPKARHKLLLFWTTNCIDCVKLVDGLRQWQDRSAHKKIVDIVAINLDEAEVGVKGWQTAVAALPAWKHFQGEQGVNSVVAREYAILSTPAMFIIDSKSNRIVSVPGNLRQLLDLLQTL